MSLTSSQGHSSGEHGQKETSLSVRDKLRPVWWQEIEYWGALLIALMGK